MEDQAEKFREQKRNNSLLLLAAARGYFKDAEALVEMGAALDHKDKKGLTALHYAAGNGQLQCVKYLWSKGAEVDAEAPDGRTPLHLAALKGHAETIAFLLQKGGWVDAEDARENTPLHLAAGRGHVAAAEALLKNGTKLTGTNKHGLSPLGAALVRGQVPAAKALLGWGAELGERPGGFSLLHLAAGSGQEGAVRMLLERGADVNDTDNPDGASPLHSAVLGGDAVCVEALLEAGADAAAQDTAGKLPIDLLPKDDSTKQAAHIWELLGAAARKGGGKKAGKGASALAAAAPKSPHEAFQALPEPARRSKVELWATMGAADLAAALAGYPADGAEEGTQRVQQLQALRARINIQKALAAAHADEELQSDAAQPQVQEAIEALRKDPSKYEQYAGDPATLSVLGKMRRLHGVCQANGQRTLNLDEMMVKPGTNWQEQDKLRLVALNAEYEAHLVAAAAAAAAPAGEAKGAAEGAYKQGLEAARRQWEQRQRQEQSQPKPQPKQPEGSVLRQRGEAAAASGSGGGSKSRAEEDARSAEAIQKLEERGKGDEDEEKLPEWLKGGFSWKKVWLEFWRQTKLALLVILGFMLLSWVVRGRPPWEGKVRGPPGGSAGSSGGGGLEPGAGWEGAQNLHTDL